MQGKKTSGLNLLDHELQYIVSLAETEQEEKPGEEKKKPNCIHGNVRRTLRNHLRETLIDEWATRKVRGELVRNYRKETSELIDSVWKAPTTNKLTMLLDMMNLADKFHQEEEICGRCGKQTTLDLTHRTLTCPSTAEIWNEAERKAWELLIPIPGTAPISTTTYLASQLRESYKQEAAKSKTLNPQATPFYPSEEIKTKISLMMAHAETNHITQASRTRAKKWAERAKKDANSAKEASKNRRLQKQQTKPEKQ